MLVAVVVLLVAAAASSVRAQGVAGTVIESISTYSQCTSSPSEPSCRGPEGYTSIIMDQSPGVGDDAIIEVDLNSTEIAQLLQRTLANPLLRENGSDSSSSSAASNAPVGLSRAFLYVASTSVRIRFPMQYAYNAPAAYVTRYTGGGGPAQANLCQGYASQFPNTVPGQPLLGQNTWLGVGGMPSAQSNTDLTLSTPSQVGGEPSCYVSCGICNANSGGCALRNGLNSETHDWAAPMFYVWRLQPVPVYDWTTVLQIKDALGTVVQNLSVGSTSADSPATQGPNANQDPTTGADLSNQNLQFSTVAYSDDGSVRFELLGVEQFGVTPYQDGFIVTQAEPDPRNPANAPYTNGCTTGNNWEGTYDNPFDTCCAANDCTQPAVFAQCTKPSPCWAWGRYGEQNVYFGTTCGDVGFKPAQYCDPRNQIRVCYDCFGTCLAGIDYWSATKQAILPPQMVKANIDWHNVNIATNATQPPPYVVYCSVAASANTLF
jgi:hypothetical protein